MAVKTKRLKIDQFRRYCKLIGRPVIVSAEGRLMWDGRLCTVGAFRWNKREGRIDVVVHAFYMSTLTKGLAVPLSTCVTLSEIKEVKMYEQGC